MSAGGGRPRDGRPPTPETGNVIGTYSFAQPDLGPAGVRQLRNSDEPDWEEDIL